MLAREAGNAQSFDEVSGAVAMALRQRLQLLAGQAQIKGVELESAETPLMQ